MVSTWDQSVDLCNSAQVLYTLSLPGINRFTPLPFSSGDFYLFI